MKKLRMQLFGEFTLTDGTIVLGEKEFHSKKLMKLLAYILVNRERIISRQDLINIFWEDNSRNPESALRNQIHLIRSVLRNFGEEEFIETTRGAYCWNQNVKVETDYEEYEQLTEKLREPEFSKDEQIEICKKIISDYEQITKLLSNEEWLFARKTNYQSAYEDSMKRLYSILEEKQAWEQVDSLLDHMEGQKEHLKAFSIEKANIRTIKRLLDEKQKDAEPEGAYYCNFEIFKELYQIEARRIERMGIAEYMMLFSLSKYKSAEEENGRDSALTEGMNLLEQILCSSLRTGDVVSRYSETQIIAMLPTCTYESSIKVAERILSRFLKQCKKRSLEVKYEIAEISVSA